VGALGDDGAASAPYTGVNVHARGAVGALGDEVAAGAPSTGVDVYARGAVYTLRNAGAAEVLAAEVLDTGAALHARQGRGCCARLTMLENFVYAQC
jgi:hypothetical protein